MASGQAAETVALLSILRAGDHVVAGSALYGGTHNLLSNSVQRMGIETTFVDITDLDAVRGAIHSKTRALYGKRCRIQN